MAVEHYPLNVTIKVPLDVILFNGITPMTGETGNLTANVVCLDTGKVFDLSDNTFKTSPSSPNFTIVAGGVRTHWYSFLLDTTAAAWKRGHYRARWVHSGGREFAYDFTLGLVTNRGLGVGAAYDGSTLKCSVWVEEFGEAQTDYASLDNVKILGPTGALLTTVGNLTVQTNGVFNFNQVVDLSSVTQYILTADATVAGYQATSYVFKLRQSLVRP
jgi:hypothetical protein